MRHFTGKYGSNVNVAGSSGWNFNEMYFISIYCVCIYRYICFPNDASSSFTFIIHPWASCIIYDFCYFARLFRNLGKEDFLSKVVFLQGGLKTPWIRIIPRYLLKRQISGPGCSPTKSESGDWRQLAEIHVAASSPGNLHTHSSLKAHEPPNSHDTNKS